MCIRDRADLDALKATIAGIGEEVTDAQIEELKAGKEKLMNSAQKLFAKMYEQTQGAGAQGAGCLLYTSFRHLVVVLQQ